MSDPRDVLTGAFDPERFFALMRNVGHGRALGLEYRASGAHWVELALPWREELVGVAETGVLASGPIISLMDNATSMAVWTLAGRFTAHATLDLRVDYMRAATPGKTVIGHGECYKLTRTIAFIRGIAQGMGRRTSPLRRP